MKVAAVYAIADLIDEKDLREDYEYLTLLTRVLLLRLLPL